MTSVISPVVDRGPSALIPTVDASVYFTATGGAPAIQNSFNVSSITDHGVGNFTVNFSSPLRSANYVVSGVAGNGAVTNFGIIISGYDGGKSASSYRFYTSYYQPATYYDSPEINLVFTGA